MRDWIWIMGIVAGIATTYGMMSSRVSALESKIKDIDMLRIDARLSVIEIQVIEINEKLDKLINSLPNKPTEKEKIGFRQAVNELYINNKTNKNG